MTSTPRNVHQAIARALVDNGIDTIFGLMGDANMYMVDSFIRDCGGRFVSSANEAGAIMMALGYASLSGKPGICSVTHGPGLTNTITGIVEGVRGSVPLVLLCGDTDVVDRENLQSAPQREFITDAGAGFEQLRSPKTVAEDVARVLRRAMIERRPVALNAPLDFDWSPVEDYRPVRAQVPEWRATVTASEDLDNAIGMIASARRPVVLAGRGAASAEAREALIALAARIEAPLVTTLKAKDLFRGEAFNLGICGTVSTDSAVEAMMTCDCLISFGASLNKYTLSHGTFAKDKRIVQVNLEATEIGKNLSVDAGLVGDPAAVAKLIIHWLDEAEIPGSGYRTQELQEAIDADVPPPSARSDHGDGTMDYKQSLLRLDELLPTDRVVVTDGGRFMVETWKTIGVTGPANFLTTINFASIGLGLSHAIGATFAKPGQPVVAFCGDGGFMNGGLAEFNTAVRHKADLIVIICNDGAYGAEHHKFLNRQMEPTSIAFDWPDFAPVAVALGGEGVTVRSDEDWAAVSRAIENRTKPLLIDLKLDPSRVPWDR
ncbi:thiamine pyrophosphate-binding protein [Sphingobium fuliginis]|uniref:Thiamine pyrophosphate-binding protein n=1 Tax=Sphingobium fuliginis ATCC 27551 TaxID=1208342 RepID=A0A5B8CDG4_SPHSA|nr:thiamine pyrophosphate-binding protein [Sphingobium fuliginis]QDC37249.1 thiamine pyrophosphate-binding protein [Sphingobium fuliginis ATCC 27551]